MVDIALKGKYSVGKKLREDVIGSLYEATIIDSQTPISIREYHNQYCHPSLVEKIQQAVYSVADLNHPNIVRVLDCIYTEGHRLYIVYDTPYQGCLGDIVAKIEKLPEQQLMSILNEVGKALEYAHSRQIIHGALNPQNIDVMANGQIKLRNFYIDDLLNSFVLTQGRTIVDGTYLAPEQLRGERSVRTTDIYALGVLTYYLLSGRKPFPEIANISMMLKNQHTPPEKLTLRNPDLPKYLEDIVAKALELKQLYRHQTVMEMLGDFKAKKVTLRVEEIKRREQHRPILPTQPVIDSNLAPSHDKMLPALDEIDIPDWQNRRRTYKKTIPRVQEQVMENKQTSSVDEPTGSAAESQNKRIFSYVLIGLFAGILLLIINAIFVNYFEAIPKVEIPVLTGKLLPEATAILKSSGFRFKIAGYVNDSTVSANAIVSTIPEAGRVVKKQRIVKLFVSKGGEDLLVPDLVERSLSSMEQTLTDKGFKVTIKEKVFSNKFPYGQVISQEPAPGLPSKKGDEIKVVMSSGYPVSLTVVDKNEKNVVVRLSVGCQPDWEPQNVFVYVEDSTGRHKQFEKLLAPGETKEIEIVGEPTAGIEVYYFNDLAYKQDLKSLTK
jgi:serine/threonine-protein kinase